MKAAGRTGCGFYTKRLCYPDLVSVETKGGERRVSSHRSQIDISAPLSTLKHNGLYMVYGIYCGWIELVMICLQARSTSYICISICV